MLKAYKRTSKIYVCLVNVLLTSILLISSGCTYFQEEVVTVKEPTEREKLFYSAEKYFINNQDELAKPIYFKITRNNDGAFDPIYDKSLWRLVQIYEKDDESAKALLTLDELDKRTSSTIPKSKIRFSQIKNHFRVTNYYQAERIRKELDQQYRDRTMSLYEVYESLLDTTDLTYDHHMLEELKFLGEVQKYFVFVMESGMSPENERLTDRLIQNYDRFFATLKSPTTSDEFKRQLSIALLDQLRKFDIYQMNDDSANPKTMKRFSEYSEKQQKKLTESLHQ